MEIPETGDTERGTDPLSTATRIAKRNLLLVSFFATVAKSLGLSITEYGGLKVDADPGAAATFLYVAIIYFLFEFTFSWYADISALKRTDHERSLLSKPEVEAKALIERYLVGAIPLMKIDNVAINGVLKAAIDELYAMGAKTKPPNRTIMPFDIIIYGVQTEERIARVHGEVTDIMSRYIDGTWRQFSWHLRRHVILCRLYPVWSIIVFSGRRLVLEGFLPIAVGLFSMGLLSEWWSIKGIHLVPPIATVSTEAVHAPVPASNPPFKPSTP